MSVSNMPFSAHTPARWRLLPPSWRSPFQLSPWALHVFFALYAANCIVFYRDRMILDTAKLLASELLAHDSLFVVHGRAFIQIPPQLLPWLAIHLGFPLSYVAAAYSLGFCLYHYAMALLLFFVFKRRDLATLLVLVVLVYLVHANFYILVDGMQIVPWALCMLAVLQRPATTLLGRMLVVIGTVGFALATLSSHPFGLPLCLALGSYAFWADEDRRRLVPALVVMTTALLLFYAWRKSGMDDYERAKLAQVGLAALWKNGWMFVRYALFAHGLAWCIALFFAVYGAVHSGRRAACWMTIPAMVAYTALIGCYLPMRWEFLHVYAWHCMLPMYAIMAVVLFDRGGSTPALRAVSRVVFAAVALWAVLGTTLDLTAFRARAEFQNGLCEALGGEAGGCYVLEDRQLSTDFARSLGRDFLPDETCLRSAYDRPGKTTILITRANFERATWIFSRRAAEAPSRYLDWYPVSRNRCVSAVIPVQRADLVRAAGHLSLQYAPGPWALRLVDGWLSNYRRPLQLVYDVPVSLVNTGKAPFPARDTADNPVMFGYYWHRNGKILYQDLKAEFLPVDVRTTTRHRLNVKRAGIPSDATLGMDLFLENRPLLHPEEYYALGGSVRATETAQLLFNGTIRPLADFHAPEAGHVWLRRDARFSFARSLRSCSFKLKPPALASPDRPVDVVVRMGTGQTVCSHRFTDARPFVVTLDAPKAGQTVSIQSSRSFCPSRDGGGTDTRDLALDMYAFQAASS